MQKNYMEEASNSSVEACMAFGKKVENIFEDKYRKKLKEEIILEISQLLERLI